MRLKLPLRVNFNVRVLCKWRGRYIEAETTRGTCTFVDESCIRGHACVKRFTCTYMNENCIRRHHVSKDFCTPVIDEACSGSQEGKFWDRVRAQKNQLLLVVTRLQKLQLL